METLDILMRWRNVLNRRRQSYPLSAEISIMRPDYDIVTCTGGSWYTRTVDNTVELHTKNVTGISFDRADSYAVITFFNLPTVEELTITTGANCYAINNLLNLPNLRRLSITGSETLIGYLSLQGNLLLEDVDLQSMTHLSKIAFRAVNLNAVQSMLGSIPVDTLELQLPYTDPYAGEVQTIADTHPNWSITWQ